MKWVEFKEFVDAYLKDQELDEDTELEYIDFTGGDAEVAINPDTGELYVW